MKKLIFLVLLFSNFIFEQKMMTLEKSYDPRVIPITTAQPVEKKVYPIAVIGSGAAGTMATKRGILNNHELLLFTGAKQEIRNSRGTWVRQVDNIPGHGKYKRAILELRYEALLELAQTALSHNLYVIEDSIVSIKKEPDFFQLTDRSGRTYYAKFVVLATGIMDEQPQIQGSIRPILKYSNAQTVAYCPLCDGHRCFGKKTVVIGHSDSAAKSAHSLAEKYQVKSMTILTNGHSPEFESTNFRVFQAPIQEVVGSTETGQLTGFRLETGEVIEAEMAFVLLGIRPNNQLAIQLGAKLDDRGLVNSDANGETSVPNLFVIGDLQANSLKQIYTAWQHAVNTLLEIDHRLKEPN